MKVSIPKIQRHACVTQTKHAKDQYTGWRFRPAICGRVALAHKQSPESLLKGLCLWIDGEMVKMVIPKQTFHFLQKNVSRCDTGDCNFQKLPDGRFAANMLAFPFFEDWYVKNELIESSLFAQIVEQPTISCCCENRGSGMELFVNHFMNRLILDHKTEDRLRGVLCLRNNMAAE